MSDFGEAKKYFDEGILHSENDRYDEAIECFTKAIKLDTNNGDIYSNRGLAYYD